jgi:hypothetical protein
VTPRCSRLYVLYVWVTSSPFSVGTRHTPFSMLEGFKVMQRYGHMADALPLFTRLESPSRQRATALYVIEAQTLVWHQMGAERTGRASGATGYLAREVAGFCVGRDERVVRGLGWR